VRGAARTSEIVVDRAQGSWLYGTDGKKFLDFSCGIAVTNTGHAHPKVTKAIAAQAERLLHGQMNIVYHQPMLELISRLQKLVNVTGDDNYFFANSGAEAVEASLKLARQHTHKQNIISFQHSFHGRTMGTMAITNSKYTYRIGYGPLMGGALATSFPYCLHCNCNGKQARGGVGLPEQCCDQALEQLQLLMKQQSHADDTAAIIVEPVLGEGGYVVPPKSFLKGLRQICDQSKVLLILDEVQTGFGRTGKWFAYEHFDVRPDILVMAKGIASGMPLSGIIASSKLMSSWKPGSHGGTYGGNAVSCAAANATIDVMQEEKVLENVNARSAELVAALRKMQGKHPLIRDVRGLGLMIGIELDHRKVPAGTATAVTKKALENGLLLLSCGAFETIRVIPPLNVSSADLQQGIELFGRTLDQVLGPLAK
jgi:4-aminobutyrate aminotransferase